MRENFGYRAWFYFRQGWSTYFAFLFAAINTLTVTYFLAIEEYPVLNSIFPSFLAYVLIIVTIAIPLLILIGYIHFKRSNAFKAEADINIEANPHFNRLLKNTELLFPTLIQLLEINVKISNDKKLSEKEINELNFLMESIKNHMKNNTI